MDNSFYHPVFFRDQWFFCLSYVNKSSPCSQVMLRVPALEKLIAMFECRSATGQYDVHVELRANVEQLVGRNEELRYELQKARDESTNFAVVVDKKDTKV